MTIQILPAYATLEDLDAAAKILGFKSISEVVGIDSPTARQVEDFIDDHTDDPAQRTEEDRVKMLISAIAYAVTDVRDLNSTSTDKEMTYRIRRAVYDWRVIDDGLSSDAIAICVGRILNVGPGVMISLCGLEQ